MKNILASLAITALAALPLAAQEQSGSVAAAPVGGASGGAAGGTVGGAAGAGAAAGAATVGELRQQRWQ